MKAVHIFYSAIWQTTTTIIHGKDTLFLVDPNYFPRELTAIRHKVDAILRQRNLCPKLIFSHSDFDHIVGFSQFSSWETFAELRVADKTAAEKARIMQQLTSFDAQYYVTRTTPPLYPRIDHGIATDGWEETADDLVYFMSAPGHTTDGLVAFFTRRGVAVAGDMLSDVEFPFVTFSTSHYLTTLEKIRAKAGEFKTRLLIPGHGHPATSPTSIQERLDADCDYLYRLRDQVAAGVKSRATLPALQQSLSRFPYRHQTIPEHLQSFHLQNIAGIVQEIMPHE